MDECVQYVAEALRRSRQTQSQLLSDRQSTVGRSRSIGKKKLSGNWDRALAGASTKMRKSTKK